MLPAPHRAKAHVLVVLERLQDRPLGLCERPRLGVRRLRQGLRERGHEEVVRLLVEGEGTGLAGGAGTYAFLVGCGWFDGAVFRVRQFVLTSFAAERALLEDVAALMRASGVLVTYNGKTFDLPVMETRWLFHRIEPPLDGVPHFDMLHPARRLWRARGSAAAPSARIEVHRRKTFSPSSFDGDDANPACCRLATLERHLFGVRRVGDVQFVMVAHHVPAGPHEEFPAVEALAHVLGNTPGGRLYKALVDESDDVKVTEVEGEAVTVIELRVARGDLGKVIGKQGRTARAIRTILNANATKLRKRAVLEIIE